MDIDSYSETPDEEASCMDMDTENDNISEFMGKLSMDESSPSTFNKKPVIICVVGMPGSGKTTFLHRLVCYIQATAMSGYVINLDPSVTDLPFGANIDIRDTFWYKEVIRQHNLGSDGGILTSLDMFASRFDEVISVIENRADQLDYILVDTPGQIDIFTLSASGVAITEAFALTFPTVITYVVDTPCSRSPTTFMNNMLHACDILDKTRLPLVLAFNKTDVAEHHFALEWMKDFEVFGAALGSDNSCSFSLTKCISSLLEAFYKNSRSVGVSAVSGAGMGAYFMAIDASANEYRETYRAYFDKRPVEQLLVEDKLCKENMDKLSNETKSKGETVALNTGLTEGKENSMTMTGKECGGENEEFFGRYTDDEQSIDGDGDSDNEEVAFFCT